jgi:hypothetical protein
VTYLTGLENPELPHQALQSTASQYRLNFRRVPVFHKVKLWIQDPQGRVEVEDTLDVVHVRCATTTRKGRKLLARFDTVLVDVPTGLDLGDRHDVQGVSMFPANVASI